MTPHKWLVVARNEYRIRINNLRRIRSYFPYLVIGLLAVYVGVVAPALVSFFVDDLVAFFLSQAAAAMIPLLMFMLFFYIIILPITYTLQGMQAGQVEIFLAAPVRPSEVLLGEFLGVAPFYAIAITVLAGFFTAALSPLGLDWAQLAMTVLVFIVTLLSALWIGTVIAALLRTRFARSSRGRDLGKALSLILALPMIAVMYALFGGGLIEALTTPGTGGIIKTVLSFLPSSWGAEVIVSFAANPGNLAASGIEGLVQFTGLSVFFVAVLWLGTKAASRAYSIEPTTFGASRVKPDGFFYKTLRHLGRDGSFSTLLVSIFKNYVRRLENLSRIIYIVGLLAMLNIFFGGGIQDPEVSFMMTLFLVPLLAVFVVGPLGSGGRESFFIYKKTPSGVAKFIKAKLLQGWLVAIPIGVVSVTVTMLFIPQMALFSLLAYAGFTAQLIAGNIVIAVGLSILNPVFSENAREQMIGLVINGQVTAFLSMGVLFGSLLVLDLKLVEALALNSVVIWALGILVLYLGHRRLDRIE